MVLINRAPALILLRAKIALMNFHVRFGRGTYALMCTEDKLNIHIDKRWRGPKCC